MEWRHRLHLHLLLWWLLLKLWLLHRALLLECMAVAQRWRCIHRAAVRGSERLEE